MGKSESVTDIKVGGKTSDEVKNELYEAPHVKYVTDDPFRDDVHYERYGVAIGYVLRDKIVSYIQQLESRLAQAERERDAAVNDLKLVRCCGTCINNEGGCTTECYIVSGAPTGWQWRGVCAGEKT